MKDKKKVLLTLSLTILAIFFASCVTTGKYKPVANLVNLEVSFADSIWDGKRVPTGQQCNKFGGTGSTPRLIVKNIPPEANTIIMEFSDRDYPPMDNGGHGKIGYKISQGTNEIITQVSHLEDAICKEKK